MWQCLSVHRTLKIDKQTHSKPHGWTNTKYFDIEWVIVDSKKSLKTQCIKGVVRIRISKKNRQLFTPCSNRVRVTRSLVLSVCFLDSCLSFCICSFGHCVVCSSSIYGFWLPLWYIVSSNSSCCQLRTLLEQGVKKHIHYIYGRYIIICIFLINGNRFIARNKNPIKLYLFNYVLNLKNKVYDALKWWIFNELCSNSVVLLGTNR
jgi:hypothetical protein